MAKRAKLRATNKREKLAKKLIWLSTEFRQNNAGLPNRANHFAGSLNLACTPKHAAPFIADLKQQYSKFLI
jgi:hypothetical protein